MTTEGRIGAALALGLGLLLVSPAAVGGNGQATATEEFLRSAAVVDRREIPRGVTDPVRLTLESDGRSMEALWKTVDEFRSSVRFADGRTVLGFYDSYKHEVAAYRLDRILELDMVPPTVERCIDDECGSLQLWIDGVMTESERLQRRLSPPDPEAWNRAMYKVRLFHNLIHDLDYNNIGNLLVDADFRIYIVDSSRAFRVDKRLQSEDNLDRFSRALLARLGGLDFDSLDRQLGEQLTRKQIRGLLARRDRILVRAGELVAEHGEAAVLYE